MFTKLFTAGISGIDGTIITIECSTVKRMPLFEIVGLPDTAVKESKDRIRSAIRCNGYDLSLIHIYEARGARGLSNDVK